MKIHNQEQFQVKTPTNWQLIDGWFNLFKTMEEVCQKNVSHLLWILYVFWIRPLFVWRILWWDRDKSRPRQVQVKTLGTSQRQDNYKTKTIKVQYQCYSDTSGATSQSKHPLDWKESDPKNPLSWDKADLKHSRGQDKSKSNHLQDRDKAEFKHPQDWKNSESKQLWDRDK